MLTALILAAALDSTGIAVVRGAIDFSAKEGTPAFEESRTLLEQFPTSPGVIYLDLVIHPETAAGAGAPPDYHTDATGREGKPASPLSCEAGAAALIDDSVSALSISAGTIYPHIVLDILIAAPGEHPFNALACTYSPASEAMAAISVTGFFAVNTYAIPTANGVRLQPITPPLALALPVLEKAQEP
ncbi:MAG: hypothetical protein HXY22_06735 [Alphaproteobacteria bacterium]|nr:hypothetical protein [Alphaproteobacteria bacterium]